MSDHADMPPAREHSPGLLIGLFVLTFLVLCVGASLLPHDPYIRYQQIGKTVHIRSVRAYERSHLDSTPIDVAVVGNSRLSFAVRESLLSECLSKQLGRKINAVNMSLLQEGEDAHYIVARQLLHDHPEVKLIVLNAIDQMPRISHPAFRHIADAVDIAGAPLVLNRDYFTNLSYLPFRQMSLFVQTLFPEAFGLHRELDPANYLGTNDDTTANHVTPDAESIAPGPTPSMEELREQSREWISYMTPPFLKGMPDIEFVMTRQYIRKTEALARANGTSLAFLYLPMFDTERPIDAAEFYKARGPLLEARFVASRADWYRDYGHLNATGSANLTRWLADQIVEQERMGTITITRD